MQALTTATRITVGTAVYYPHHCTRWSRACAEPKRATVAQLTCGGMYSHYREGHECSGRFAHLTSPCGSFAVAYTDELVAVEA